MELLILFGTALTGNALWFVIARRRNRERFVRQLVAAIENKPQERVQQSSEEDGIKRARR
jgi:hypothetical protein